MTLPVYLTPEASNIVRRGGSDAVSDDQMLLLEIASRAPGMSQADLQKCFVACLAQYGKDALRAIRSGHVQFAEREGE